MITENVSNFKIHKLTQEQYDRELAAGTLDENAIYLTPNDDSQSGEVDLGIQVEITSLAGATVYCTDQDGNSSTGVIGSDGKLTMPIPDYGTYTFYAELDGVQTDVVTVNFDTAKLYQLELPFISYKYYGVKIKIATSDPASAVTYIDDAEGMSSGWSNWKDTVIFKDIKPCVLLNGEVQYYLNPDNYAQKEDGTTATINSTTAGDVMVEIPKLGYKMTKDSSYHYIWVTNDPNADGYCYDAHSKETEGDCDKIYIGAYLGYNSSSKLYSISGKSVTVSKTLTNFRTYATARGDGYELFSFYPLTLLQCLFLIIFKNRNSQTALGMGYVNDYAATNTGGANSSGFMYGSTSDTEQVKFLGIEDFWGNCYYWVDGIYSDGSSNILTYYKNMSGTNNGSNYQYSYASGLDNYESGYVSDVIGTNHGGFVVKACSGSTSTYYADYGETYFSGCAYFGGVWDDGSFAGAFQLDVCQAASYYDAYISARLVYKHVAQ